MTDRRPHFAGRERTWVETFTGCVVAAALLLPTSARADEVLLKNGIRIRGKVVAETPEIVTLQVGSRKMTFPLTKIRILTIGQEQRVFAEAPARRPRPRPKPEEPETRVARKETATKPPDEEPPPIEDGKRSKSEVEALIKKAGKTQPEWWDSAQLNYPRTLDLNWPNPRGKPWQPNKYLGQYVISVINPNPGRWKSGARLFHHVLSVNRSNRGNLAKTMDRLAHIYGNLLGDHARGAFWLRAAGKIASLHPWQHVNLANCYWRLGNKDMAKASLRKAPRPGTTTIKLWSDMGDLSKALSLARAGARGRNPEGVLFAAGNACRQHGKYKEAMGYYQKLLDIQATGKRKQHVDTYKNRARASLETVKVMEALDLSQIKDGKYRGSAMGFRGNVAVEIEIRQGRIESAKVVQHKEDWFYTSITDVPERIVERQGLTGVDGVTGATITSVAIVDAAAKALASGMR